MELSKAEKIEVQSLMQNPIVKAHCAKLDRMGVLYQVIPILPKKLNGG